MRDIVEQAIAGDEAAFARLVEASADRLYAIAVRTVRDPHTAEDVVQHALVTAWRELPRLRDPDRFEAWTYRLVIRAAIDETRRRKRTVPMVRLDGYEGEPVPDAMEAIAGRDLMERALARVSVEHRAILCLFGYLDLSGAEIADVLGIPYGTAVSRLHHAMRSLRAAVDAEQRAIPGREAHA
jgi:RNA polymerase sigma-70 factor (ECF subfamily)